MPRLLTPSTDVVASLRAAAAGEGWDDHPSYRGVARLTEDELCSWVGSLVADAREDTARPEGFVPSTNLWWVERMDYLGRIQLRHRLTPFLREVGGHIGFHVVLPARRRGHATAMLAAALPVAAGLGLECVLLTCDATNTSSRRAIENNGGLFADQRGPKLRYWVPTVQRPGSGTV